jgi:hypothetical protein
MVNPASDQAATRIRCPRPCLTNATVRPDRSGNVTAHPEPLSQAHITNQARAGSSTNLSQLSHGLERRHWTQAPLPDTWVDHDLRIRIPAHWLDTFH